MHLQYIFFCEIIIHIISHPNSINSIRFLPSTPQGGEEHSIRQKLKRQIQIIKGRRHRRLQTENPPTDNPNDEGDGGATASTASIGTSPSAITTMPMSADLLATFHEEEEQNFQFCSRGLEHYFTPREERRVKTARQKSAIRAVLDRQRWQMVQCNVRPLDEASTIGQLFAEAASRCRSDALERAAADEVEASKVHNEWVSSVSIRIQGGE